MKKTNLTAYLAAGAAVTTAGQADAATIVTIYGSGAQNPSSPGFDPPVPAGINIGTDFGVGDYLVDASRSSDSLFASDGAYTFTSGTDLSNTSSYSYGAYYALNGTSIYFYYGAAAGDQNFANISFDGNDGIYEAVGQFSFDGEGNGYLVALAVNDDDSALSISAGKAAIDAIPEPTTAGLLALGAAGLATMRRRKSN